jgi:hypothetical protein
MLMQVREEVHLNGEGTFTWPVALKDSSGAVYVEFDKVLYVAKRDFYEAKLRRRAA